MMIMMMETYVKNKGVYNDFYEAVYTTEYESTIDGDWLYQNHSKEAEIYRMMTDKEQDKYAHYHATWWVNKVMAWTVEEYERHYGDQFDMEIYGEYVYGWAT